MNNLSIDFKPLHLKWGVGFFLLTIGFFQFFWMTEVENLPTEIALFDVFFSSILLYSCFLLIGVSFNHYLPSFIRFIVIGIQGFILTVVWILFCKYSLTSIFSENDKYLIFWENSMYVRAFIVWILICDFCYIHFLIAHLEKKQISLDEEKLSVQMQKDAELFKLRQQVQPHFLFNSLNSVNALIVREPKHARLMVQQLSDFLRNTLKKEDELLITFEEELVDLQLYLSIEQVRFGHRLVVKEKIQKECFNKKIPPFLLQPLMENAIKHGLYGTIGSVEITIEANIMEVKNNFFLSFKVSNPYDSDAVNVKGTGFGLSSIKRRLYLLFAQNDLLEIMEENDIHGRAFFHAHIKIPVS